MKLIQEDSPGWKRNDPLNQFTPFDKHGNQQDYPSPDWQRESEGSWKRVEPFVLLQPVWRSNEPFKDTLILETFRRGRSAAHFLFRRENGKTVWVFITDMVDSMCPSMVRGEVTGTFQFVKRGANFGCVRIGD